jgi:hypothetical protein
MDVILSAAVPELVSVTVCAVLVVPVVTLGNDCAALEDNVATGASTVVHEPPMHVAKAALPRAVAM